MLKHASWNGRSWSSRNSHPSKIAKPEQQRLIFQQPCLQLQPTTATTESPAECLAAKQAADDHITGGGLLIIKPNFFCLPTIEPISLISWADRRSRQSVTPSLYVWDVQQNALGCCLLSLESSANIRGMVRAAERIAVSLRTSPASLVPYLPNGCCQSHFSLLNLFRRRNQLQSVELA